VTAVFVYHINNYKRMLAYSSVENMGILIVGTALGGVAMLAAIIHLIGHSLIKASFFLTSGNVLEIYGTKKIKSVTGLLKADKKTGWLWVLSMLGILAFPPSLLFISEFMMVKELLQQNKIGLCVLFVILLTIVLYGIGKSVIRMAYSPINEEKTPELFEKVKELNWTMYAPQIIMLAIAFYLGVCMPSSVVNFIASTVAGLN
jgi:hydrogenase-4 component F